MISARIIRTLCLVCLTWLVGCGAPQQPAAVAPATELKVIALTPGITELIYAVGAQASLLATVEYSDYPAAARRIPRIGDAFHVDVERIAALHPDLVLAGGSLTHTTIVKQLEALHLRVESVEARRLSDIGAALRRVGELTGHGTQANQVAQQFDNQVAELTARHVYDSPVSVFVEVSHQPLYTINGQHLISEVLQLCGGVNVFADLNQLAPVISVEAVLKANPQVMLSGDTDLPQFQSAWQRWPQLQAVQKQQLYVVSPDALTRASPRILVGINQVCAALAQARSADNL